ncbi:MAG: hypothetical protein WCJ47_03410 [Methanomicrobiales archaeon]
MIPWIAVAYEFLPARMPVFCIVRNPAVIGKVPIRHTMQPVKPAPE